MSDLDEPEFRRWRDQAGDTAAFARRSAGESPAWACFLAEQAAQFAIKALLHGSGAGAWGHDLPELVRRAATFHLELDSSTQAALRLSRFYLATRYPDASSGGVPARRYTLDDARAALADADDVVAAVDAAWAAMQA